MPFWFYSELLFSAAFVDSKNNASSWIGVNLGTASADRIIVVATSDNAGTAVSSVTVDGVSGTRRVNNTHAQLWTALATANTTGTITVVSSSSLNGIGVYALYGLQSDLPVSIGTGTATATVNVNAGGFAIACISGGGVATATWSGVTLDYFALIGGAASSASQLFSAAQTPLTISVSTTSVVMAAASWGPTS